MNWFRSTKKNTDDDSEDLKKNDGIDIKYNKTDEPQIENNTVDEHDTLSSKLELVQQEYHKIVHELMTSKKEFNKMKADIQKLNDENDVLTSKIKSGHTFVGRIIYSIHVFKKMYNIFLNIHIFLHSSKRIITKVQFLVERF